MPSARFNAARFNRARFNQGRSAGPPPSGPYLPTLTGEIEADDFDHRYTLIEDTDLPDAGPAIDPDYTLIEDR